LLDRADEDICPYVVGSGTAQKYPLKVSVDAIRHEASRLGA